MNRIFTFLFTMIYIIACNTVRTDNQASLKRIWMLTSFENYSKESLMKKNCFLDLSNEGRASAKMGCNNLSFSYQIIDNGKIQFSNGISTKMACPEMELESKFNQKIITITGYTFEGQKLILTQKSGKTIEFIAQDWD